MSFELRLEPIELSIFRYSYHCSKLASQFSTLRKLCMMTKKEDIDAFIKSYGISCDLGYDRLVTEGGIPSGIIKDNKTVAEAVQHFITCMNALELGMKAADDLLAPLQDLMSSLNKTPIKDDSDTKKLVKKW